MANGGLVTLTTGLLFYWLAWIFWVLTTFFMSKTWKRTFFSCWILLIILCANIYIENIHFPISLSLFILFVGVAVWIAHLQCWSRFLVTSFIIMIGYTALLFWEHNTPVWLFMPRTIMLSMISTLFISSLAKPFFTRVMIGLMGMSCGELMYSLVLAGYGLENTAGGLAFLDCAVVTILWLIGLDILQKGKKMLQLSAKHIAM